MLKDRIKADCVLAIKQKDTIRKDTLRLLLAAIKQYEVDQQKDVDDEIILSIISKQIKQRNESIGHYRTGNRSDLVEKEKKEISILVPYLPKALSDGEVASLIDSAISEIGASSLREMGRVMEKIKPQATGRYDISKISQIVKSKLG